MNNIPFHKLPILSYNSSSLERISISVKACEIPKTQAAASREKHEVVPLELAGSPAPCPEHPANDTVRVPTARTAVTVRMPGYSIELEADAESYPHRWIFLEIVHA